MKETFEIRENEITIRTTMPLLSITKLCIELSENSHHEVKLDAVIRQEYTKDVLNTSFYGDKIVVLNEDGKILFYGLLEKVKLNIENKYMEAEITGCSHTVLLDGERRRRSFQNTKMTYQQLLGSVLETYGDANFNWELHKDKCIGSPIIQYDETDWQFLIRMASHFHTVLYADEKSGNISFSFGVKSGREKGTLPMHILKTGASRDYYIDGFFQQEESKKKFTYIEVKSESSLDIGDKLIYNKLHATAYRKKIILKQGKIINIYRLGLENFLYKRRISNKKIAGISLNGVIKKSVMETLYLQLDIDKDDNAQYPWPWVPETGNLCFAMPEAGMKAALLFPSDEEQEGIAVYSFYNEGSINLDEQNRGFQTLYHKKIGLWADRLFLEGKDGGVSVSLEDSAGIKMDSSSSICFKAGEGMYLHGKKIAVNAALDIVCRTDQSNIEMCRDFNFFAPKGVQTKGTKEVPVSDMVRASASEKPVEHWEISYSAMAAVPSVNFEKGTENDAADLMASGSIPKIGSGKSIHAMEGIMEGKSEKDVSFPGSLQSMEAYTEKGGYRLPSMEE